MAKRATGVNSKKKSHPRKTKKRLEIKRARLIELASKKRRHNRRVASIASLNI
jgi:hypothetical protein